MRSTLFLNNVTQIDYAFIDEFGRISGMSVNPIIEVCGNVEKIEQVVVDFSKIKKTIKQLIDNKEEGFDHKLWFMRGESTGNFSINEEKSEVTIYTPYFITRVPKNSVRITEPDSIKKYLDKKLNELFPQTSISTEIKFSYKPMSFFSDSPITFTYVHGLKNSSSWGCQNINHGHLSFAEVVMKDNKDEEEKERIEKLIFDYFNGRVLIFRENITNETDHSIEVSYETERGRFWAWYNLDEIKVRVFDTETTIENLVMNFVNDNKKELKAVKSIYLSEGLTKGAVIHL